MDRADLELFERSVRHAAEQHTGAELDVALDDLGWSEALADEPRSAVSVIFEVQGRTGVTSSALDRVMALALGAKDLDGDPAGLVLPAAASWDPPGVLDDGRLTIRGVGTVAFATAATAAVVASGVDGDREVLVRVPTSALERRQVEGLDSELGLFELRAADVAVGSSRELETGAWAAALAAGRVAIAHDLVGASRAMLTLAREHALDRIQFGVPISSFQAVRHRLAEALVAVETADAVLDAAWLDPSELTAAMAKSVAGRSARTVAKHCQQVLAGIGFTTEHPFQGYVRRVLVLDTLLGRSTALSEQLGRDLLASRRLPPLLPL